MTVPFVPSDPAAAAVELFVYGVTLEDVTTLAFEANALAAESLVSLWLTCRGVVQRGEAPSDFLVCAIEQQAWRVRFARARAENGPLESWAASLLLTAGKAVPS